MKPTIHDDVIFLPEFVDFLYYLIMKSISFYLKYLFFIWLLFDCFMTGTGNKDEQCLFVFPFRDQITNSHIEILDNQDPMTCNVERPLKVYLIDG